MFSFFSKAENLQELTPAKLNFEILTTTPIPMEDGAIIDYQLKFLGIPFKWKAEITQFRPMRYFVDMQRKGPYAHWHHLHHFKEVPGGTVVQDVVHYRLRMGWLGKWANLLFVRRSLGRIFEYRKQRVEEIFQCNPSPEVAYAS